MSHSVCGGPSEPRSAGETLVVLGAAWIAAKLESFVGRDAAAVIGSLVASRTFDLPTFCAVDPPADPGVGPLDLLALTQPEFLDSYLAAVAKFGQWWDRIYWFVACQCTANPQPAVPTPSNPGTATSNPGLPGPSGDSFCWTAQQISSGPIFVDTGASPQDWQHFNDLLPGNSTVTVNSQYDTLIPTDTAHVLPSGQITDIAVTITGFGPAPGIPQLLLLFYDASGTQLSGEINLSLGPTQGTEAHTLPAPPIGAASWLAVVFLANTRAGSYSITADLTYQCAAGPNPPQLPCCPPDPTVELRLNQILQLVANLSTGGGGSSLPTSWQDGIRHQALSGAGRFTLGTGAVGVRAEITSVPPNVDVHPGDPNFYFDLGYITPLAIDVPLRGQRLVFNPQSFAMPEFADGVAYTLLNGAIINLVELLPVT